jgi:hypothetical protein
MRLSVVVPTFNRGVKLRATLDSLLMSDTTGLEEVEIIVVDDGSPTPASLLVESVCPEQPFSLRCIRQDNAGPAAARNTGFRASSGDIVLFMDDDILCTPKLLRQHVEAHRVRPGCVIFGSCPYVVPQPPTPLYYYIERLVNGDPSGAASGEFVPRTMVASGQLSLERTLFDPAVGVYRDGLATPAAEEFELSHRLWRRGISVLHAPWIIAGHDHPIAIESLCRQQYKHAVGYAEVAAKVPATLELHEVRQVIATNGPGGGFGSLRQLVRTALKRCATARPVSKGLLHLVKCAEFLLPRSLIVPLYSVAIRAHFCAGVRDGLRKYAAPGSFGNGRPGDPDIRSVVVPAASQKGSRTPVPNL